MVKAILDILATLLRWVFDPARKKESLQRQEDATAAAVRGGDAKTVNARLNKLLGLTLVVCLAGCATTVDLPRPAVAAPTPPSQVEATPIVYAGVRGWFLPDPLMERIMRKLEEAEAAR